MRSRNFLSSIQLRIYEYPSKNEEQRLKKGNLTRERRISEMEIGKEYRVKKDEVDIKWVQSVDL